MVVFGWLQGPRGSSETLIPLKPSIKNKVFKVSAARTPLGSTFEWLWERLRMFPEPFSGVFLGSLGHFDGRTCQQLSLCFPPRQVLDDFLPSSGLWGGFWMIFRSTFGCSELIFYSSLIVHSWIFSTLSEGHCGRCALHFSHALEVFCFSAKRLDLLFLLHGYAALSRGSPCMTNHQGLYDASNFSIGSL